MSSSENIVFSDMGKYAMSEIAGVSNESVHKERNSCRVKTSTGFVLVLLALVLAVGVGLIVHFAENRKIECNFPGQPGISNADPLKNEKTQTEICRKMVKDNKDKICKYLLASFTITLIDVFICGIKIV